MALSTTTTSTHILAKYSKSYPQQTEWQHFTNPTIRLVLDVKKSDSADLESVRLRILWTMNSDDRSNANQREVVFEDLELLSFSSLPLKQYAQGLPLKAVYRDTVVGIRYLYDAGTPIFRRFQITFTSLTAATQFINAIRTVCPCKANPTTQGNSAAPQLQNFRIPSDSRQDAFADTSTRLLQNHGSLAYNPLQSNDTISRAVNRQQSTEDHAILFNPCSNTAALSSQVDQGFNLYSSSPLNIDSSNPRLVLSSTLTSAPPRPQIDTFTHASTSVTMPPFDPNNRYGTVNHTPTAVQPICITSSISDDHTLSHSNAVVRDTAIFDAATTSLVEDKSLYKISRSDLEKLVGDVVREDGFLKLLEDISSMWKVTSLLD